MLLTEKYWLDGQVFEGIPNGTVDDLTEKFWFDGEAAPPLFVSEVVVTSSAPHLLTLMGVGS